LKENNDRELWSDDKPDDKKDDKKADKKPNFGRPGSGDDDLKEDDELNSLEKGDGTDNGGVKESFGTTKVCKGCHHPLDEHDGPGECGHSGCRCMDFQG
jgi:hypothetical protein